MTRDFKQSLFPKPPRKNSLQTESSQPTCLTNQKPMETLKINTKAS